MLIQPLTRVTVNSFIFSACLVLHKVTIDLQFRQAKAQWRIIFSDKVLMSHGKFLDCASSLYFQSTDSFKRFHMTDLIMA